MLTCADTLFFRTALLPGGWARDVRIDIADGVIVGVTEGATGQTTYGVALPGMANVHSHAFQRGLAGLAEHRGGSDSFWTWREVMYRFVSRLSPDDMGAIAALAYAEMLEAGFTRVGEFHYLHHDPDGRPYSRRAEMAERIVEAADLTGIGLTLLPVFYEQGGFDGRPPGSAQRRFCNTVAEFEDLFAHCGALIGSHKGGILGVAPHSLRAVSPASLAALAPLMENRPTHIHIAEQRREVADCIAWSGKPPVRWLMDHVAVDARWCFIHATHTDVEELRALAASGAVAGLCPISEANLGDGLFALPVYLAAGGRFGIGTDSHILLSLVEELRILEYGQRLARQSRNIVASDFRTSTGAALYLGALSGGAQALGVRTGLEAGAPADILALADDDVALASRIGDAVLDGLIFASTGRPITDVWRAGRKLVSEGRHRDKEAIVNRYRRTLARLLTD